MLDSYGRHMWHVKSIFLHMHLMNSFGIHCLRRWPSRCFILLLSWCEKCLLHVSDYLELFGGNPSWKLLLLSPLWNHDFVHRQIISLLLIVENMFAFDINPIRLSYGETQSQTHFCECLTAYLIKCTWYSSNAECECDYCNLHTVCMWTCYLCVHDSIYCLDLLFCVCWFHCRKRASALNNVKFWRISIKR